LKEILRPVENPKKQGQAIREGKRQLFLNSATAKAPRREKEAKKLFSPWTRGAETRAPRHCNLQMDKSFLVLFFKKRTTSFLPRMSPPPKCRFKP
jgi:hypothetical protein